MIGFNLASAIFLHVGKCPTVYGLDVIQYTYAIYDNPHVWVAYTI